MNNSSAKDRLQRRLETLQNQYVRYPKDLNEIKLIEKELARIARG